ALEMARAIEASVETASPHDVGRWVLDSTQTAPAHEGSATEVTCVEVEDRAEEAMTYPVANEQTSRSMVSCFPQEPQRLRGGSTCPPRSVARMAPCLRTETRQDHPCPNPRKGYETAHAGRNIQPSPRPRFLFRRRVGRGLHGQR